MIHCYRSKRFGASALERIEQCNQIIERYQEQDLRLTLRQLYYQLVTQNIVPNTERSYKNLGGLLSDARLAGLIDWDAIEDRVRQPHVNSDWNSIEQIIETALQAYRLPRWADQNYCVELWVEKDALAGVLQPLAREWHVTMMINRGYSSQSAMYESARRLLRSYRVPVILYLGDHDPSGEDMVRDISDRLVMFGVEEIQVQKVALTMEQIQEYNPPPNPAKLSDTRAAAYIEKHGDQSWEVDALPPEVLRELITDAIEVLVDLDAMDAIKEQEETEKLRLRQALENLKRTKKSEE